MRLDDGQADGDELAEELKNLLRGHHVLLPDDVLHLHQPQQQEVSNQKQITRSPNPPPLFNTTQPTNPYPDSRGGLLAGLEQLGDVPPHLPQLQLPPVPQQLDPRDRQLQQRLATHTHHHQKANRIKNKSKESSARNESTQDPLKETLTTWRRGTRRRRHRRP